MSSTGDCNNKEKLSSTLEKLNNKLVSKIVGILLYLKESSLRFHASLRIYYLHHMGSSIFLTQTKMQNYLNSQIPIFSFFYKQKVLKCFVQ